MIQEIILLIDHVNDRKTHFMKLSTVFFIILSFSLALSASSIFAASQGRKIQYIIKRTSASQRPHNAERKKVPPEVAETSRYTSKFVQKNRWFVRRPNVKLEESDLTSSRRYLPQPVTLDDRIVKTGTNAKKVAKKASVLDASGLGFKYKNVNEREIKTGRKAYEVAQPVARKLTDGFVQSGHAARRLAELRKNRITKQVEEVSRNVLLLVEKKNDISDTFRPSP